MFKKPVEQKFLLEASALLELALRLEPNMLPALLSLADRLLHRYITPNTTDWGSPAIVAHVADLLSRAEAIEPNNEWLCFYESLLLRARGRWREASLLLQRLTIAHPNNIVAHRALARCLMILGKPDEACELFERSVRRDPVSRYNRLSYAMIGKCLLLQGNAGEAVEWMERGLQEAPENDRWGRSQDSLYLASALALKGDIDGAHQAIDEANRFWPFGTVGSLWPFYEPAGLPTPAYAKQIQRVQEGLRLAGLREYADESSDFGIAPSKSQWPHQVGFTPTTCPGATTICTQDLAVMVREGSPVLIDVAVASWGQSLPGAIGLQGTGFGADFPAAVEKRFRGKIIGLLKGGLTAPIVVFCVNSERFTAYNLALRLLSLGCTSVYWYRGGVEAWQANNLPTSNLSLEAW